VPLFEAGRPFALAGRPGGSKGLLPLAFFFPYSFDTKRIGRRFGPRRPANKVATSSQSELAIFPPFFCVKKRGHKLGYAQLANLQRRAAVSFGPGVGHTQGVGLKALQKPLARNSIFGGNKL